MPPKRHTIDYEHQGMLLPPPSAEGNMTAGGATVTIEGSIFPDSSAHLVPLETPRVSPEQAVTLSRLEAEHRALDSLALENRSAGNITTKTNRVNALEGDFYQNPDIKTSDIEDLHAKAENSKAAKEGLRLASKGSYAKALGIAAHTELVDQKDGGGQSLKDARGNIVKKPIIVSDDPAEQEKLDAAYRAFRLQYYGTRNHRRLNSRRLDIQRQIRDKA